MVAVRKGRPRRAPAQAQWPPRLGGRQAGESPLGLQALQVVVVLRGLGVLGGGKLLVLVQMLLLLQRQQGLVLRRE